MPSTPMSQTRREPDPDLGKDPQIQDALARIASSQGPGLEALETEVRSITRRLGHLTGNSTDVERACGILDQLSQLVPRGPVADDTELAASSERLRQNFRDGVGGFRAEVNRQNMRSMGLLVGALEITFELAGHRANQIVMDREQVRDIHHQMKERVIALFK